AGFWAWDPVEIATLVLWLVSTLYFHVKTLVPRNHALIYTSGALGWVAVTFASFVVRGGLLQGFHSYAGAAKAIIFGLLFLGSTLGLIYPLKKSNEKIVPDKLFAWKKHTNKIKLSTFWLLIFGITINTVGLFIQMVNALITHETDIPYAFYIPLNGAIFFAFTILILARELNISKLPRYIQFIFINLSSIAVFVVLYSILSDSPLVYILGSIIGSSLVTITGLGAYNLLKKQNIRRLRAQIIHITIIMMIFAYFTVDMGSIYVNEALIPEKDTNIEELGLIINATRVDGRAYPEIIIFVCVEDGHLGIVKITQGYHLGNYWTRGDWITLNNKDLYFSLQSMGEVIYRMDAAILIEIHSKPLTNTFRMAFYLLVLVTTIGLISTIKKRPIGSRRENR
ncbi:MAG: hypothetical protein ACXAC2_04065, partial [Candidatus Kariarchaeaceae archaeon]